MKKRKKVHEKPQAVPSLWDWMEYSDEPQKFFQHWLCSRGNQRGRGQSEELREKQQGTDKGWKEEESLGKREKGREGGREGARELVEWELQGKARPPPQLHQGSG